MHSVILNCHFQNNCHHFDLCLQVIHVFPAGNIRYLIRQAKQARRQMIFALRCVSVYFLPQGSLDHWHCRLYQVRIPIALLSHFYKDNSAHTNHILPISPPYLILGPFAHSRNSDCTSLRCKSRHHKLQCRIDALEGTQGRKRSRVKTSVCQYFIH